MDEKRKTSLEKMVATELLKLVMETEEGRKERLKKMVANPVSPPHKKMKVAIILQIHLVGVCMAERRNKVTRIFASTGSIYIISTHWRSGLLLCCFHQLLEHSVKFTPLK